VTAARLIGERATAGPGGERALGLVCWCRGPTNKFFISKNLRQIFYFPKILSHEQIFIFQKICYDNKMDLIYQPVEQDVRIPRANERILTTIYEGARKGLGGDNLALYANLTPRQFRQMANFDTRIELAEAKGRADSEYFAAAVLHDAAAAGDVKAATDILRYQHGWVAKTQLDVNIDQRISVTKALELAEARIIDVTPHEQT
jgi:hypothetical protein